MPTFAVDSRFVLQSRRLLVLSGRILEGTITRDMHIRLQDDRLAPRATRIEAIEFVDGPLLPVDTIAICVKFSDGDELQELLQFDVVGRVLTVK